MDVRVPMNVIAIAPLGSHVPHEIMSAARTVRLPSLVVGRQDRPRWTTAGADPLVEAMTVPDPHEAWIGHAERLLASRVGTEGHPSCRVLVLQGRSNATLLLAMHHALADYRSGLFMLRRLLAGRPAGRLAGPLEDALPESAFGRADAARRLDEWWSQRASLIWAQAGLQRLAANMPAAGSTRIRITWLSAEQTQAIDRQRRHLGMGMNAAIAVAIARAASLDSVSHAIDMTRYLPSWTTEGPGIAISHLYTPVGAGGFREAARAVQGSLREQMGRGAAGDQLLALPDSLFRGRVDAEAHPEAAGITGVPVQSVAGLPDLPELARLRIESQFAIGPASAGGCVINLFRDHGRLGLIVSLRPDDPADLGERIKVELAAWWA